MNELDIERIFSYAQALEQSGRQKNMVFYWQNVIYIMNADKSILLRFDASQDTFPNPGGFYVSDYDSPNFVLGPDFINFIIRGTEFSRNKKCRIPNQSFVEVEDLFYKFYGNDSFTFPGSFTFHKDSLQLLNESLSHIEFQIKNKEIKIIQRDIYSGTIIELERKLKVEGLGLIVSEDDLPNYLPITGMRTNDFLALFNFNDKVKIHLPESPGFFLVEGMHNNMQGIVAGCLYDELGGHNELGGKDGWEKSEEWSSEQVVDRQTQGEVKLCQRRK